MLEVDRDGNRYRQEYAKGGKPQGKLAVVGTTPSRGRTLRHHGHVLARPDDLRRRGHRVHRPHRARAPADDGVPQQGPGDRLPRRARRTSEQDGHLPVQGRHRRLRQAPQRLEGGAVRQGRRLRGRDEDGQTLDIAHAVEHRATTRASTATPTASPPSRAACTSRASRPRSPRVVNKYARAKNLLKEKDDNLLGEDIREGITAIVAVKLREPAVRGPDQGQARQRPDALVRAEGHQRAPRPSGWRRTRPRPTGWSRRRVAAAQARVAAKNARNAIRRKTALSGRGHARQAEGLLVSATPTRASCSSSRATPPAAPPSTPAIRAPRRSCRSAARSSTSSGPGSTRC